jgi:hypothetical protein
VDELWESLETACVLRGDYLEMASMANQLVKPRGGKKKAGLAFLFHPYGFPIIPSHEV